MSKETAQGRDSKARRGVPSQRRCHRAGAASEVLPQVWNGTQAWLGLQPWDEIFWRWWLERA